MKKRALLFIIPLIAGGLAGCTGSGTKAFDGKPTVTFWHTFGQIPLASLEKKVETFKKLVLENEGVEVAVELSYQGAYKDMPKKVTTGLATGEAPTIAVAYPDHVADYFQEEDVEGKYVVNLDTFINDSNLTFGVA